MRRFWLLLLVLACPLGVSTAGERIYRLGELAPSAASLEITRSVTLPELAKLGFEEGRNLILEERAGDAAAMPGLARELLLTKPDAVIAIGSDAIRAASEVTTTVPIVTLGGTNLPVEYSGLAPGMVGVYQINLKVPFQQSMSGVNTSWPVA